MATNPITSLTGGGADAAPNRQLGASPPVPQIPDVRLPVVVVKQGDAIAGRDGAYDARLFDFSNFQSRATGDLAEENIGTLPADANVVLLDIPSLPDITAAFIAGTAENGKLIALKIGGGSAGLIPVRVETDGGSEGSSAGRTSFTYTVTSLAGVELGTGVALAGNGQRVLLAKMNPGTYGTAYYDTDGTLRLMWVDETFYQLTCMPTP